MYSSEEPMKTPFALLPVLLAFLVILGQNIAFSCPVCFGALDDPATQGMNVAILTLLGVTGTVLAGLISFFLRLRRFSRAAAFKRGDA